MLTLADLEVGRSAIAREVLGDDSLAVRIMEMGITGGEIVQVIGVAPLGDPIEIEISGYRLSLRKEEARRIPIEVADGSASTS